MVTNGYQWHKIHITDEIDNMNPRINNLPDSTLIRGTYGGIHYWLNDAIAQWNDLILLSSICSTWLVRTKIRSSCLTWKHLWVGGVFISEKTFCFARGASFTLYIIFQSEYDESRRTDRLHMQLDQKPLSQRIQCSVYHITSKSWYRDHCSGQCTNVCHFLMNAVTLLWWFWDYCRHWCCHYGTVEVPRVPVFNDRGEKVAENAAACPRVGCCKGYIKVANHCLSKCKQLLSNADSQATPFSACRKACGMGGNK